MRLNVQCGLMFSMCCFKFMLHEATDILIVDMSYLTIKQVVSKGKCCLNCRMLDVIGQIQVLNVHFSLMFSMYVYIYGCI